MSKTKAHTVYKLKDGTRVGGVTTIVGVLNKPALLDWANRIGLEGTEMKRYVDDKADIGTLAHDMVISKLKGTDCDTSDYSANQIEQATWAANSFWNWAKDRKIKPLICETPLVSEKYCFGGTEDIYAEIDDARELLDLKSGSGIYPEHITQVSGGYEILLEENGYKIDRTRILNIPRTNNENWGELIVSDKQRELHRKLFLGCLNIYNLQKELRNEKVVYPKKHE